MRDIEALDDPGTGAAERVAARQRLDGIRQDAAARREALVRQLAMADEFIDLVATRRGDRRPQRAVRGAYMITATPTRQTSAPVTSYRSGRKPSATIPHASDPATNTPPYAADPSEVRVRLERGDEAVEAQRDHAGADPEPAAVLTDALPDQPGAADLGDGGEREQEQRGGDRHGPQCASPGSADRPGDGGVNIGSPAAVDGGNNNDRASENLPSDHCSRQELWAKSAWLSES